MVSQHSHWLVEVSFVSASRLVFPMFPFGSYGYTSPLSRIARLVCPANFTKIMVFLSSPSHYSLDLLMGIGLKAFLVFVVFISSRFTIKYGAPIPIFLRQLPRSLQSLGSTFNIYVNGRVYCIGTNNSVCKSVKSSSYNLLLFVFKILWIS